MSLLDTEFLSDILDQTHVVIMVFDESGGLEYLTRRAADELGVDRAKIDRLSVADIDEQYKYNGKWGETIELLKQKNVLQYESQYTHLQSGKKTAVALNLKLIQNNSGTFVIASSNSIERRLFAERELAHSKEMQEIMSRLARVGGWNLDLISNSLEWSDMTKEIHEVPPDFEPDFQTAINFYKEGPSRDAIIAGMTNAIERGQSLGNIEVQLVTAKGNELWVRSVGDVERDKDGKVIRAFGSFQDIDNRKRIELKLEESYRLLKQLTTNLPGAVYQLEMDQDGQMFCPFVSEGIRDLYPDMDLPDSECLNDLLNVLIDSQDFQRVRRAILRSAKTMSPLDIDFRYNKGTEVCWMNSSARPERGEGGRVVWHGYVYDITDRKRRRAELQRFVEVTSEQNKRLLNFAYIVSHNIRSHVANLKGILDIIQNSEDDVDETFMPLMQQSVDNLDESIRNLNEVVTIQSQVDLSRKSIYLNELLDKTLLNLSQSIKKAGSVIHNRVPEHFYVKSNSAYIESIFLNLISNAVKYRSPDRKSEITILAEKQNDGWTVEISDNGLGIDMEKYRQLIFGMYKTFHRNKDAKGLGLFITKNQVEALGGTIELESELNKGTTVRIKFYG